jgi:hypothetical protein
VIFFMNETFEFLQCRATAGAQLTPSEPWQQDKPVRFIWCPAGITTLTAGFRKHDAIECTVICDAATADAVQDSFERICEDEQQEPYIDEDHRSENGSTRATIRLPVDRTRFVYGTVRGRQGIVLEGGEPTGYGAEVVNSKTYRSFSPEFATDCDMSKAICANSNEPFKKCTKCKSHRVIFSEGGRGSETNPARIVAVNFVAGSLVNRPAFKNMPPVKAHHRPASWVDSPALAAIAGRMEVNRHIVSRIIERSERQRTLAVLEIARKNKGGQP